MDLAFHAYMSPSGVGASSWPSTRFLGAFELSAIIARRLAASSIVDNEFAGAMTALMTKPSAERDSLVYASAACGQVFRELGREGLSILQQNPSLIPGFGHLAFLADPGLKSLTPHLCTGSSLTGFWQDIGALYSEPHARHVANVQLRDAFRKMLDTFARRLCVMTFRDWTATIGISEMSAQLAPVLQEYFGDGWHVDKPHPLLSTFALSWCLSRNKLVMEYLSATGDTSELYELFADDYDLDRASMMELLHSKRVSTNPLVNVALAHDSTVKCIQAIVNLYFLMEDASAWSHPRSIWLGAVFRASFL